jgi:hypothetical protein
VNMAESLCGVNSNGWTLQLVLLMIVNGINMNGWGVGVEGLGGAAPGWNFEFANVNGWALCGWVMMEPS